MRHIYKYISKKNKSGVAASCGVTVMKVFNKGVSSKISPKSKNK